MPAIPRNKSCLAAFAAAALLVAAGSPTWAAITGYLKIPDIDGESTRPRYEGWSELSAFQVDVSVALDSSGGGRPNVVPSLSASFSMEADLSYPELASALLMGVVLPEMRVHQVNDSGGVVFEHVFEDVVLGSLRLTETPAGARMVGELGRVEFYSTIYRQFGDDGQVVALREMAYDFVGGISSASAAIPGDYNLDGRVDDLDRDRWAEQFGFDMTPLGGGADGNADGRVDAADFTIWRDNASNPSVASTPLAIPEPAAAALALCGSLIGACRRRVG